MSDVFAARVRSAIEDYLAPLVESDGGRIALVSVSDTDDAVVIALEGACEGCPARSITRDQIVAPLLEVELGRKIAVEFA